MQFRIGNITKVDFLSDVKGPDDLDFIISAFTDLNNCGGKNLT
jgi:hypothetical protein